METITLVERAPQTSDGLTKNTTGTKWRARIIASNVWGSSGYYSSAMLSEATTERVFSAGTPIYLDHPGVEEKHDRPERSVRDLAGKLDSDAVAEADGLYANITIYPHWAEVVEALAPDIGLSIRASAEVEEGEAEGRKGTIVKRLVEADSVDLVTKAGAGGRVISLIESARTAAVRNTKVSEPTKTPTNPAGAVKESKEEDTAMKEIEEVEYSRLVEADSRVKTLEAERDTAINERDQAQSENQKLVESLASRDRDDAANGVIDASGANFNDLERAGLKVDLPVTESGELDTETFTTRVTEAVENRTNPTKISGFGARTPVEEHITVEDFDAMFQVKENTNA